MAGAPGYPRGSQETTVRRHSARLAGVTSRAGTRHLGDHGQGQRWQFFQRQIGWGTGDQGTGAVNMLGSWNSYLKLTRDFEKKQPVLCGDFWCHVCRPLFQ